MDLRTLSFCVNAFDTNDLRWGGPYFFQLAQQIKDQNGLYQELIERARSKRFQALLSDFRRQYQAYNQFKKITAIMENWGYIRKHLRATRMDEHQIKAFKRYLKRNESEELTIDAVFNSFLKR